MSQAGAPPVRFRDRSELLDFLLEVSAATSSTLDLDQLLSNVSEVISKVVDSELFAILLYNEKRQDLRIRYAFGHREEVVKNLSIPLGEGITGAAALTREPVVVENVREDSRYLNALDAIRSEIAVPMVARNKLVGVIDLQSTRPAAYTNADRAILRLIASRVAESIGNARLHRRVLRQNRTLETLASISREFSSILDLDELLGKISKIIRALINYDAFSILLLDAPHQLLRQRFSLRYDQRVTADSIPVDKGITGAAATSRGPVLVNDTLRDPRYIASHADIRSEVAVPLLVKDRVIGVIDLESDRTGYFTEDHVRILTLLAPQIAASVENARLYEEIASRQKRLDEDLSAARQLQTLLLPTETSSIEGMDVAIVLRPAREISGDIYDFFQPTDEHHLIAFGDVSGKGAAAALYGALVSGLLRSLGPRRRSPALLVQALNEALVARRVESRYVTLVVLQWHPSSGLITMTNAAATPPLICRRGQIIDLKVEGLMLGLLHSASFDEVPFQTEPGDVLVLYSDGITDQLNSAGKEYGKARLSKILKAAWQRQPREITNAILADLDKFTGAAGAFDDQTLLVMKVKE